MSTWLHRFGFFFYLGLVALAAALAYSLMTQGILFAPHPFLAALRAFGVGFIASGMALWIALRRTEAGHTALNPLFSFLVVASAVLLMFALLFPFSGMSFPAELAGVAFGVAALAVGLVLMIFAPAFPKPIAQKWPEDAQPVLTRYAREDDAHHHEGEAPSADDLTLVEGIGPRIDEILKAAGVTTYAELAAHSPEELEQILESAAFKAPFDPASWPEQAQMAAAGDLTGLHNLQEKLVAGRAD
jgi:predicted flap endonuclease-1-like 5' DNA nuclease